MAEAQGSAVAGSTVPRRLASSTRSTSRESFGITQQVILHIGRQGRLAAEEVAPRALTQQGIAEATGARQNTLTNILRRLVAAGVLAQDVRHVRGGTRRLRVYHFTSRGESVYEELRRRPGAAHSIPANRRDGEEERPDPQ